MYRSFILASLDLHAHINIELLGMWSSCSYKDDIRAWTGGLFCCADRIVIPYSRKYWRELNLAVGSQIAILNVLADLNLAVQYGIATCIYASKKFWRILIWQLLKQTAKLPNLIPRQIFRLYGIRNWNQQSSTTA